ncbi:SDR family oxidoreductase [Pseudohoeflea coraliihabitans]|uniref:SDR family oxidoreductase n=1 Tax=Pseudohoeflea coraliihabitans TaxID=2860393 RepID=A0ABS6WMI5_9HYPH|nr:SDR family oxidoreductase [Pseudohoeflea sp. DP4N28-3]MBW3096627.1 SDR family oxidoreductase [Pseudohoeflea sp. DP4N28-3]
MPTVLITGCDHGIGREFACQYAQEGWEVIATYRDPENRIDALSGSVHASLDVTDEAQFTALKAEIGERPIDLIISNAGIGLDTGRLGSLDFSYVRQMYEVNTIGPLRLIECFADNLKAGEMRRFIAITSRMGSISLNLSGGHYGYRASKAGLNAMVRSLAIDLFSHGITVTALHPGWVDTAGGGGNAAVPVAESVQEMRMVISRLGNHDTGQLYDYKGVPLPW